MLVFKQSIPFGKERRNGAGIIRNEKKNGKKRNCDREGETRGEEGK